MKSPHRLSPLTPLLLALFLSHGLPAQAQAPADGG